MPTALADPEIHLMLRVQRDDPGAFAELVAAYWSRVFGKFVRQVCDRQEAEDLAQDVFLRLYRSRKRYRPRAKLSTWVFFIARNVGRNALRRRRRKKLTPVGLPVGDDEFPGFLTLADDSAAPYRPVERAELARVVRVAVATLNRRQRRAVELQFEDHTYNEIASQLAMSPKAAKSLLYRARNELRDALLLYADG
ncbi:MAG TPA: sigma-70 family RNA polymerase sigma factor [Gemmataceae bacterium]|nr:sigma-70 family RNA polymerase sigma factor [Gemmataceae bacterium]